MRKSGQILNPNFLLSLGVGGRMEVGRASMCLRQQQAFYLLPKTLKMIGDVEGECGFTLYFGKWIGRRAVPFGRIRYILGMTGEETVVNFDVGPSESFLG